jgi:hypothetical protein
MRLSNDRVSRCCRLLFTVSMVVAWCDVGRAAAQQPPGPDDRGQAVEALDRLLKLVEAADREGPRDTVDAQAVVRKVGREPAKLFEWVRDNTHWVPYQGALRGPTGVLMDRVGNSLDRSLLLAELLRLAGEKPLLVRATPDEARARELVAKVRPLPKDWLDAVDPPSDDQVAARLDQYAARYGLEPTRLRASTSRAAMAAQRLAEDVAARVAEQSPAVTAALQPADPSAPGAAAAMEDAVRAAKDHWWVRLDADGKFTDFDPLLPDAKPQSPAGGADGQAQAYDGKLPNDPSLCHEVEVRVTIERWEAGRLVEEPVLTHVLRPADLLGRRVALSHVPVDGPDDVNLLETPDASQTLKELAGGQHAWVPVLRAGSDTVMKAGFTDAGRVDPNPKLGMKKVGGAVGGAASGALDAIDTSPAPAARPDTHLTAEWIDYEIRSPGRAPVKVRRQLFDLVGPAARTGRSASLASLTVTVTEAQAAARALSTLGETEIFLQPCNLSQAFVDHLAAGSLLANGPLLKAFAGNDRPDAKWTDEQAGKVEPGPGRAYALGLARGQWSPVRGQVYLDRPNVLTYHQLMRLDPSGKVVLYEGFDVVCNDVSVREADPQAAKAVRARQGVADTAAEAALAGGGAVENASNLFAAGAEWVTLRGADDPGLQAVRLPDDVLARLRRDLADGNVVIVPKKPAGADGRELVAWWRVDPRTGAALGIGRDGWGAAAAENALIHARIMLKAVLMFKCIGGAVGGGQVAMCVAIGVVGAAGIGIGGFGGGVVSYAADILSAMK